MASMVPSTRGLLDAWGRQTAAITKSIEGTNNWTLLLSTDDGEMALRLYRTVELERVQQEHRLLQALQLIQLPFRTPSPLNTTALETTAQLIWHDRPVIAALFPMLPGPHRSTATLSTPEPAAERSGSCTEAWPACLSH